jgi:hypothetical protein
VGLSLTRLRSSARHQGLAFAVRIFRRACKGRPVLRPTVPSRTEFIWGPLPRRFQGGGCEGFLILGQAIITQSTIPFAGEMGYTVVTPYRPLVEEREARPRTGTRCSSTQSIRALCGGLRSLAEVHLGHAASFWVARDTGAAHHPAQPYILTG